MTRAEVLDDRFMAISAIVTVAMQLCFFAVAYSCQFDKVTDFAGAGNFTLLAVMTLALGGDFHERQLLLTVIVVVSRIYLAGFLLYRVISRGKDDRFDEIRNNFFSFLGFWIFQMIWAFVVSLPVIFVNSVPDNPDLEARDWVGLVLAVIGLLFEVVGDLQKNAFRANPENRGRICDEGLWSITRHPNYFGEILLWWGVFVLASPVFHESGYTVGYATILSPVLTMVLLLFLSGMPTAEGAAWSRYTKTPESTERLHRYLQRTPPLIPFIPQLYARMPLWVKRALCLELPMFQPPSGEGYYSNANDTETERASPVER